MSRYFHFRVSGRNNSKCESLSSPAQRRHVPLSPTPSFNFPIPRQKHAMQLFSFIVQQVVYACLPQECFKSPSTDIVLFSLISASHLSLDIRTPEIDDVRGPYFCLSHSAISSQVREYLFFPLVSLPSTILGCPACHS